MSVYDLQKAILAKGLDRLIVPLLKAVCGKELNIVSEEQRQAFVKIVAPFRVDVAEPPWEFIPLERVVDFFYKRSCKAATSKAFSLVSKKELKKYIEKRGEVSVKAEVLNVLRRFSSSQA